MQMVPTGYVHLGQLDGLVKSTLSLLGPEVANVAYRVTLDSTDVPSIFFRILLKDEYIREETLADLTGRIGAILREAVGPLENWGLRPYFNFRSKSGQDRRRDPGWE